MIIQWLLVSYLVLIIPILEYTSNISITKQLKNSTFSKSKFYLLSIIELWFPVILLFLLVLFKTLSITDIGLNIPSYNYYKADRLIVIILSIIGCLPILYLLLTLYQIIGIRTSTIFKKAYYAELKKKKDTSKIDITRAILPKNKIERIQWFFVSITAGITEEILFRGFLVYFLHTLLPELPIWIFLIIQTIPFGLMHLYQGKVGVLISSIMGLIFGMYTYLFGSIVIGMIIHTLVDLAASYIENEQTTMMLRGDG